MSGEHEKNPNHSVDRIRLVRQLIERMCRELETGKRMKVWWDMKNCPVPEGYDPLLVRRSIESYLYKREYHSGPLTIVAFGNLKDIPVEVLRAYSDTGIVMKHDPFFKSACANVTGDCTRFSTIMKEMGNWKVSHISTPVLFISNPENACNLYFHMKYGISMSDSNILLAFDYDGPGDFPALHFTWKDLLEDAKIDCVGKKNIEDEFTYPGGIFCTVCITYCEGGTRVEDGDLATHLRSETHEIETFGKTAKTLFHGELRLAYKWGAYLNIPLERMTQLLSNHPENKRKSKEGKMIKRKSKDRAEPTITENYAPSISPVDDKKEDVEEEHREIDLVDIFGSFTPEKDSAVEKDNVDIGGEEYEENLNKHLSITEEEIADVDDDYGSEGEQGLNAAEALRAQVNLEVQKRESSSSRSGSSSGSDSDGRSKSVSSGSGQSSSGTSSRGSGRSDDEVNSV